MFEYLHLIGLYLLVGFSVCVLFGSVCKSMSNEDQERGI
jgi:hypothetical protein